jgi:hypothetical protein
MVEYVTPTPRGIEFGFFWGRGKHRSLVDSEAIRNNWADIEDHDASFRLVLDRADLAMMIVLYVFRLHGLCLPMYAVFMSFGRVQS